MQSKEDVKSWLIERFAKSSITYEPTNIDFKRAEDIGSSFLRTISAFANTDGGWIILGIHERNGKLNYIGIENPTGMESKVIKALEEEFNINLIPNNSQISIEHFEGYEKPLIFVNIQKITESLNRPCHIKSSGERYLRWYHILF